MHRAVDLFYSKVMAEPLLAPHFAHIDMNRQRDKMSNFVLFVLGGSEVYTGPDMWQVHKHMVQHDGVGRQHFEMVLRLMAQTLDDMGSPLDVKTMALEVMRSTEPQFHFPPEAGSGGSGGSGARAGDGTGEGGGGDGSEGGDAAGSVRGTAEAAAAWD